MSSTKRQLQRWKERAKRRSKPKDSDMTAMQKDLFDAFQALDVQVQRINCGIKQAVQIAGAMKELARTLDTVMDGAQDVSKLKSVPTDLELEDREVIKLGDDLRTAAAENQSATEAPEAGGEPSRSA